MTSKSLSQNAFLDPDLSRDPEGSSFEESRPRKVTVYDAVAGKVLAPTLFCHSLFEGRISVAGFISKNLVIPSTRDTSSSSTAPVAPESVLFRQKKAPTRYVESDVYFANERELRTDLPESDLLKALHCYASDLYSYFATSERNGDYHSMDETALLAFGILMEEAARERLGRTGDLVFAEGEEDQENPHLPAAYAADTVPKSRKARVFKKRRTNNDNEIG